MEQELSLKDAIARLLQLQEEIGVMLDKFTEETGLAIVDIDVGPMVYMPPIRVGGMMSGEIQTGPTQGRNYAVGIDVRLPHVHPDDGGR